MGVCSRDLVVGEFKELALLAEMISARTKAAAAEGQGLSRRQGSARTVTPPEGSVYLLPGSVTMKHEAKMRIRFRHKSSRVFWSRCATCAASQR